jgi:hypothetical protein
MAVFKEPMFLVGGLLAILLIAWVMGAPVWITGGLALLVLLYGGIVFSRGNIKDISAKKGKVVCWKCKYDNKSGSIICKQCKVKL